MILDVKEYNVQFEVPTDNFIFNQFTSHHTQYIKDYLHKIKKNIPNSNALIILFGAFENLHEYDHWIAPLNDLTNSHNNPIVVFNGRLSSDNRVTIKPTFCYHKISVFDYISNLNCIEPIKEEIVLKNEQRSHKFYWASSKDLYVRRYLLAHLIKNNLLENNLVNYKCISTNIPSDYLESRMTTEYVTLIEDTCDSIKNLIPLPSLDQTIEFNLTNKKFYNSCYLGIITDTFYADFGEQTGLFFSEKIFQAMNYHQIFFYFGPPHSLEYLKQQGYYIFDDIFDLSFDKIENHGERLVKATESLITFLKQPIDRIKRIYHQKAKEIHHNKVLLRRQNKSQLITNLLRDAINVN